MLSELYKIKLSEFEIQLDYKVIFHFIAKVASYHLITLQFADVFEIEEEP